MTSGVINVYKEAGMTSFQVVYQIRKLTGEKKCGHTGTLDPDATGVLPVCIGKATKLVDLLMDTDKQYRARLLFGKRTDTQDLSGAVLEAMEPEEVHRVLESRERILAAFSRFTGQVLQLPPMYSAVKVDGVKLVDAARRGREIERQARPVEVFGYEAISIFGLEDPSSEVTAEFTVNCSKGTYIRTLCEDLGAWLGVPACMASLERSRTSGLSLETAHTLSEIQKAKEEGQLSSLILPTDQFLMKHPALFVKKDAVRKLAFGNYLTEAEVRKETSDPGAQTFRVYSEGGVFYAIYEKDPKDGFYKCSKMFIDEGIY